MKKLKKLSREELRNVSGGKACSLTIKQADGSYQTYPRTCVTTMPPNSANMADLLGWYFSSPGYCETALGNVKLTSNGGVSRCND